MSVKVVVIVWPYIGISVGESICISVGVYIGSIDGSGLGTIVESYGVVDTTQVTATLLQLQQQEH